MKNNKSGNNSSSSRQFNEIFNEYKIRILMRAFQIHFVLCCTLCVYVCTFLMICDYNHFLVSRRIHQLIQIQFDSFRAFWENWELSFFFTTNFDGHSLFQFGVKIHTSIVWSSVAAYAAKTLIAESCIANNQCSEYTILILSRL